LFLRDGQDYNFNTTGILDLEFWNNNPAEYIYCGFNAVVDPTAFIRRFDEVNSSFYELGTVENLEISKQNDSLLFASASSILKSTDGGRSWFLFDSSGVFSMVSLDPFDDNILFVNNDSKLYKSTNGGLNYFLVDTSVYFNSVFYYDKDSVHIYNILDNRLRVSDAEGNAFSWTERYSSSNPIYLSVDHSQSGSIYLADGKYIYHSTDYGVTFNEYETLDRRIVGIYKKPSSDKLYATTKYKLFEITSDSIKVIKSLQPDPALAEYYPLAIGDKWVYEKKVCSIDFPPEPCVFYNEVVEVIGDTVLSNGFNYYIIKETNPYGSDINLERYNREDATVRRYIEDTSFINSEYIIEDLIADAGDTLCTNRFYTYGYNCEVPKIFINETTENLFNGLHPKKRYVVYALDAFAYSLVKGFGIDSISFGFDFGYATTNLKGCIINDVLYGDTTVVGINEPDNLPKEFYLFQNYPNPFNPTTKIKFVIPPVPSGKSSFVNLKVYDILGREVATLIDEEKQPGNYEVEFNPVSGVWNLASGIYFYRLQANGYTSTKKMIYLK